MLQDLNRLAPVPAPFAVANAAPTGGRDRSRERRRYRPGTRVARQLVGNRKDRMAFLELLARRGDPAVAADELGLPLLVLFRHRDADPAFAAEWTVAVGYAWERVESRVLAALLAHVADTPDPKAKGVAGLIDSRLALAIVNRRDKPGTQVAGRAIDGASVARLRAELQALAKN
jgi:hypothetical protein